MTNTYSISVVIPIYNEAELLADAVHTIHRFVQQHFQDYELLLIESGSRDDSGKICDTLSEELPNTRVHHEGARNGYGSALRTGFQFATKDLVTVITADTPFALESMTDAVPHLSQYDAVLSYRSKDNRKSGFRKVQSLIYNLVIKLALGTRVRHINSAFKLYKRPTIQSLTLISRGWFIDAEIVYWLTRLKIPYTEIPVELIERTGGQSTITLSTPLTLLKELQHFLEVKNSVKHRRM
jgi:glycosyltransferase involved in cell wall biosynthesis